MNASVVKSKIESSFLNQVKNSKKVKSAFLLVHSDKLGINLNIAEGETAGIKASPEQPNHMQRGETFYSHAYWYIVRKRKTGL